MMPSAYVSNHALHHTSHITVVPLPPGAPRAAEESLPGALRAVCGSGVSRLCRALWHAGCFAPVSGYDRIEGDFSALATPRSLYNWLETHPLARRSALAGLTAGAVLAAGVRSAKSRA